MGPQGHELYHNKTYDVQIYNIDINSDEHSCLSAFMTISAHGLDFKCCYIIMQSFQE
jgi:hypothetical protein